MRGLWVVTPNLYQREPYWGLLTPSRSRFLKLLTHLACPSNISNFWGGGFILGFCLVLQLISGIFLSFFYSGGEITAFASTIAITRDVSGGWLVQALHANGASFFFFVIYMHIGRGIYYKSYNMFHTWMVGVTIFLALMATAFLGYVLPWGQMSFWAAQVITGLCSAVPYVGSSLTIWLWGGFSVSDATLIRFYGLHYLVPFLIAALSLAHIFFLHESWSNNPLGSAPLSPIVFQPYFTFKDMYLLLSFLAILMFVCMFSPRMFVDPENFIPANPMVTPVHIQPEWYFLPMYAILRSIPNKLGGVIGLVLSIAILYISPLMAGEKKNTLSRKMVFWWWVSAFVGLGVIGSKTVASPFTEVGVCLSVIYFGAFFALL